MGKFAHQGNGTTTTGRIDLYKRGCFVLEAKQGSDAQAAGGYKHQIKEILSALVALGLAH